MRILTWNINGIRTIPQYHPWNTLKSHDAILDHLDADIINFQEVKSNRTALPAPVAAPPSYDAYYSFPLTKNGYSGVATYTRRPSAENSGVTALKAEEGLTGKLRQPHLKPPPSDEERVSRPEAYDYNDRELGFSDIKSLDAEGRVLTLDFGLFVLINVYCPNDGSSAEDTSRLDYKMAFHRLLEARVRALIREGREVILLGDINACAAVIDHCEGDIIVRRGIAQGFSGDSEEYFWMENDARRWLRDLLEGGKKCFVDVVRKYYPERRGMFTCWNTKLSARASNYGTRIDYILATPGLLPWIKAADIEPTIKGSDHCPVWIDLHDEISLSGGRNSTLKLRDVMSCPTPDKPDREPPRLATRFWDEYSGKQRLLASFFNTGSAGDKIKPKVVAAEATPTTNSDNSDVKMLMTSCESTLHNTTIPQPVSISSSLTSIASVSSFPTSSGTSTPTSTSSRSNSLKKRKTPPPSTSSSTAGTSSSSSAIQTKPKKPKGDVQNVKDLKKPGQSKLSSFFVAPPTTRDTSNSKAKNSITSKIKPRRSESIANLADTGTQVIVDLTASDDKNDKYPVAQTIQEVEEEDIDEDLRQAIQLSLSQTSSSSMPSQSSPISSSHEAWKSLLKPREPPKCLVHNEVAKEFRVNKPGVNKGRSFWVCSRPVGPGYDKGRSERPREEVDSKWKCNYFVWSSDIGVNRTTNQSGK
ncbi:Endonuclease/exonuclease/phosphatase [Lentinula edodes]|uniref:Endonuclease/exonuclease/phosphatase n=1 Tax=Lentinula edodes TaxID=5353 RepID=UPI001E8D9125|nr:Endonuclease/exonuclease/phosphatase [Lentinula edodes]KAH7872773.1 Endonuclease/exonuclease/phosphatase [Lentinula edodes]